MLKGIHPLSSDRVWTCADRVGATAALLVGDRFRIGCRWRACMAYREDHTALTPRRTIMDGTTLLIIILILIVLGGGGWYGRGRWY